MPAPLRRQLEIVVRATDRQLSRCLVRRGRYVIGHDPSNEIIVDEPSVSARHARLTVVSDSEIYIEDFGSANGTFADGQLCQNLTRIQYDSVVQLGECTLEFQRAGLPAEVFQQLPEGFLSSRRFELGKQIVSGSLSTIHEAQDVSLAREVAIRVMQPDAQSVPKSVLRFIREAQITSQLQHPNIPPVYELRINEEGRLYYTTRAIEGESLGGIIDRLRGGSASTAARWTLHSLLTVFQKICDAVAFAHSRGVMHGSLQPENIVVGEFGELLVLGWTYAILMSENPETPGKSGRVHASGEATPPPITTCTAPEQASGTGVYDERADVYALGAILYTMIGYAAPFPDGEPEDLTKLILTGDIEPPQMRTAASPDGAGDRFRSRLVEIAMKALSHSPESRQASVAELQTELASWQEGLAANNDSAKKWKGMLARRH